MLSTDRKSIKLKDRQTDTYKKTDREADRQANRYKPTHTTTNESKLLRTDTARQKVIQKPIDFT